jgi:hypothetical protein
MSGTVPLACSSAIAMSRSRFVPGKTMIADFKAGDSYFGAESTRRKVREAAPKRKSRHRTINIPLIRLVGKPIQSGITPAIFVSNGLFYRKS